jgi:hypothetical protein
MEMDTRVGVRDFDRPWERGEDQDDPTQTVNTSESIACAAEGTPMTYS